MLLLLPSPHNTMKEFFTRTYMEIDVYSGFMKNVLKLAFDNGYPEEGASLQGAELYLQKLVKNYNNLTEKAESLGYSSPAHALKALAQVKDKGVQGIETLPEEFHSVPQIWRRGRAKTSVSDGFAPLTLRSAQREHTQVIQLLLEAWPLTDEGDRDAMLIAYLSESAEDFKQQVYDFLYRTDSPLEEQLLTEIKQRETMEKWQDWGRTNENARAKEVNKRRRKAKGQ